MKRTHSGKQSSKRANCITAIPIKSTSKNGFWCKAGTLCTPDVQTQHEHTEEVSYTRKKKKKHPGRNAFPEHLAVEEEVIEPEQDTTGMVCIGNEISDTVG